jgi:methionyl-tRNA formyltransferase
MTKVVFFGSSEYSVIILQKLLILPEFSLTSIVTKTDKPAGRNLTITPNPVTQFAHNHHLPLLQIEEFDKNCKLKIKNSQAQLGLCVAFGPPFFDQDLIDLFPKKIINIHPSPLPKYRGATPGPWQIINGEIKSAVTFFQIDSLPDHGPIVSQIPFEIAPSDTSDSFYQKAFNLAAINLDSILSSYLSNSITLNPQDHNQKSYYPKLSKDTAKIDWNWDTAKLKRFVRAMLPWPVAWTYVMDKNNQKLKMKIYSFDSLPIKVQIEGKTPVNWTEIEKYYTLIK